MTGHFYDDSDIFTAEVVKTLDIRVSEVWLQKASVSGAIKGYHVHIFEFQHVKELQQSSK